MVALDEVQRTNQSLQKRGPGLVGVFVGGNSGIGASTLKAFARYAEAPRVYILARNASTASEVISEAKAINPSLQGTFISVDATLLTDISRACERILQEESYINLLVFTCGGFSFTGRQRSSPLPSQAPTHSHQTPTSIHPPLIQPVTSESLDRKLSINYYSRLHLTALLLPALRSGAQKGLSSVLSILGAGRESPILESDLGLEGPGAYTLRRQFTHCIVSTDLMFERLAAKPENAGVSFVHQFPGYVPTKQVDSLGLVGLWTPLRYLLRVLEFVASPLSVPIQESGERTLFSGTSARYPPRGKEDDDKEVTPAVGSDGVSGSGAYLLHWNGESVGVQSVLQPLRDKDFGAEIEKHFLEIVQRVTSSMGVDDK